MLYNYRKIIIVVSLLLVVAGAVWATLAYFSNFQKVTVTYDKSMISNVELYSAFISKGVITIDGDKLQTIESGKEYSLKKGIYALKPIGDKIKNDPVELDVKDTRIATNLDADYKDSELSAMYESDKGAILTALNTSNPRIQSLYKINAGKLYHHGEWFGTTMSYIGTETLRRDTLRVIVKKEGSTWKVVAPPAINLSVAEYPAIPAAIVRKVNNIDLGLPLSPGVSPDPIITYPNGGTQDDSN